MRKLVVLLGILCLLCPVCRAAEYEPIYVSPQWQVYVV